MTCGNMYYNTMTTSALHSLDALTRIFVSSVEAGFVFLLEAGGSIYLCNEKIHSIPGRSTEVDKMSKVFNFSVNTTNLKRISNGQ